MKYCINPDIGKSNGLSNDLICYLLALYLKSPITDQTFINALKNRFVKFDGYDLLKNPTNVTLTDVGELCIKNFLKDSEFNPEIISEDRLTNLALQMRELFPKGRKDGTQQMWRDSTNVIAYRLKRLIELYHLQFTDEEAINATQRYIDSFNGDYKYMQTLSYFIFKDGKSQFASYLENKEDVIERNNNNDIGVFI